MRNTNKPIGIYIKQWLMPILLILAFSACDDDGNQIILSEKLVLKVKVNDGIPELSWNKPYVIGFQQYGIVRSKNPISDNDFGWNTYIDYLTDFDSTTYIDYSAPLAKKVYYKVVAMGDGQIIESNQVEVSFDFDIYDMSIHDVLISKTLQKAYFVDRSKQAIFKFDYNLMQMEDSLFLTYNPEFCDVGDNGFGEELYVTGNGGVLRIYDASTLEYKDDIDAGLRISCVTSSNKGFLIMSVEPDPWWEQPLRTYSRSSKALISGNGDFDFTRVKFIPETNEAIEITRNIGPVDCDYYKLNSTGTILSHKDDSYHGDHPLDYNIFRVSPNGKYFVTDAQGALYTINMVYKRQYGNYSDSYNDFCFNDESTKIYGGNYSTRTIDVFNLDENDIDAEEVINTKGFTWFMFYLDGFILSIESTESGMRGNYNWNSNQGVLINKYQIN